MKQSHKADKHIQIIPDMVAKLDDDYPSLRFTMIPSFLTWRSMALSVIVSQPIIALYSRAQKYFIEGLTVGVVTK